MRVSGAATEGAATRRAAPAAERADDGALIARMAAGDERALGALYDRWSPAVYALALGIVGGRDDAEDVVEETFWQAWRGAERYASSRGAVATWLLTIARSRALDRRRAMRRRREETLADAPPEDAPSVAPAEIAPAASDPAQAAELAERRAMVAAALGELPREQREALELAYFGGLSQTEIAARTSEPLGTVKTRIRLAMQKLRERLAPLREGIP